MRWAFSTAERSAGLDDALAARTLHSEAALQLVEDGDLFKHVES
jgi:hypothetical protein